MPRPTIRTTAKAAYPGRFCRTGNGTPARASGGPPWTFIEAFAVFIDVTARLPYLFTVWICSTFNRPVVDVVRCVKVPDVLFDPVHVSCHVMDCVDATGWS